MKILKLELTAYGPFSGKVLDLSAGKEGLHIIYGPNEAGKSSALRAIGDLFYGIPSKSKDNFVHSYPQLRIAAQLQHSTGTILDCVRRKGTKKTLRQPDETPIDEEQLTSLLGNVDRDLFHSMFGINHDRLRQGGEEILKGGGRVGKLLFASGAGLANLQGVQKRIQDETDALFKPTGRIPAMNRNIKEYQETQKELKELQVSVNNWKQLDEILKKTEAKKKKLDNEIQTKQSEQNYLTRIHNAVTTVTLWKNVTEKLKQLKSSPLLADDFSEKSQSIIVQLKKTEQKKVDAESSLKNVMQQLKEIKIPTALLEKADEIELLRDGLGGYQKAMSDRPALEAEQTLAQEKSKNILQKLGRNSELTNIEELRLPEDKIVRIQNLGNQHEGLLERLDSADNNCDSLRRKITSTQKQLKEIDLPSDAASLPLVIRQTQQEGDLEAELSTLGEEIQQREQKAQAQLEQLTLWSGSYEEAEKLAIPSLVTIERFEQEFRETETQLHLIQAEHDKETQTIDQLEKSLEQLELEQPVPTQEKLSEARHTREAGWQLILDAWNNGTKKSPDIEDFIKQFSTSTKLSDAYYQSVSIADQLADDLRNDAKRVAEKAKLNVDSAHHVQNCKTLKTDIKQIKKTFSELKENWVSQWKPLSISPLPPKEMRHWRQKHQEVVILAETIRNKQLKFDQQQKKIKTVQDELSRLLTTIDIQFDDEISLRNLLQFAEETNDQIKKTESQFHQLQETLTSDQSDLVEAESQFKKAKAELKNWTSAWAEEMQQIDLENNALPAQANSVLANINNLFQAYQEAEQYQPRIEGIDREASMFKEAVGKLTKQIPPDDATLPVEEIVKCFSTQLQNARLKQAKYDNLKQQQEEQEKKITLANETISDVTIELNQMCQMAQCKNYNELTKAAQQSTLRKETEQRFSELETQLMEQSGGTDLEVFVTEVEKKSQNIDFLKPQIDELKSEIDQMNNVRDELLRQIEREEGELSQIDGSAMAAEKSAKCESIAAQLEEQFSALALFRMASVVLHSGIEKYREKNQGAVLERAGEIFSKTTLNAFKGLQVDYDDSGIPTLTGVRSGRSERVQVAGMSDGTRDQLYLALRLASLETWLDQNESIPFIIDDVLLNFDDDRAIATMHILSEWSSRIQVIFFTHHKHLVEMVKAKLPEKDFFVHHLG
ncbi:Chromosome partition protein smc [hydrothermal vent metagenome]|uniref:Chromosome partition protein smc n=1 Tax=hydrothermal vent metagenome TaxID=652676 RepID=A0A3B1DEI4_9ZZZZ